MQSITVRNVNHALPLALALLRDTGRRIAPRGMPTLEIEGPFATTYQCPEEMILFDDDRDANPFFHFFESLWILAGRDDVQFLAWLLPRMADFSDDGVKFHAPYGHRMRTAFGFDQIEFCIKKLTADPDTRQAVVSIWHPGLDWQTSCDLPCNDMLMFKLRDGNLRLTVCNRSNDAVLGAYGANVVQFSTLLRYVAAMVGVEVGTYTQVSDSFHVYESNPYWQAWLAKYGVGVAPVYDPYQGHVWQRNGTGFMPRHEVSSGAFDDDLKSFFMFWDEFKHPSARLLNTGNYATNTFKRVVLPMLETLIEWRANNKKQLASSVTDIGDAAWQLAANKWMNRRVDANQ